MGLKEELADEVKQRVEEFRTALLMYRSQEWDAAQEALEALRREEPESMLYRLYLERISLFREEPPGESWDGVFTHKTK